jgi:anti-anti-sigma factor
MRRKLEFEAEKRDDLIWIYTLSGDLFGSAEGYAFQDEVRERVAAGARKVLVDLSAVHRIDSSGVGILVTIMWSTSQAGGGLVMAALPKRVEQVLSIAMLLERIDHAETVEAGLAKLGEMPLTSVPS